MTRVLHVLNGLGTGGAEAIIMNLYRYIDRTKIQFDFLIRCSDNIYADEIEKLGGRVYVMPPYPQKYFANKQETKKFFCEHAGEYSAVHVHGNALLYVNVFNIAKKHGINVRIFHSHSTSTSLKYLPLHLINKFRLMSMATDFLACSDAAGKWAFGSHTFKMINNGVVTEHFKYNEYVRNDMRRKMKLSGKIVYGHVGRFAEVKNHIFLLDVFEKIVRERSNSVLMLIGAGELKDKIENLAKEKGIADKVVFVGTTDKVGDYMQAMDMFLFPSLHEGYPIVAVEAQAAGLPSILADTITKEVAITDLVEFLPITDSNIWSEHILKSKPKERKDTSKIIVDAGFDIKASAKFLENYYLSRS